MRKIKEEEKRGSGGGKERSEDRLVDKHDNSVRGSEVDIHSNERRRVEEKRLG